MPESKLSTINPITRWWMKRKMVKKSKQNIAHALIMAAFYRNLQENEEAKDKSAQHGVKASQLESSAEQEERFLNFITDSDNEI